VSSLSFPDTPAETDIEKIVRLHEENSARLDALTDAVNGLGSNIQWVIDNAKGIFEMFSNPAFMSQMMGGFASGGPAADE
jgi:hypothetical protein